MRIALLTPFFPKRHSNSSGVATHYRSLALSLGAAGHDVTVVHLTTQAPVQTTDSEPYRVESVDCRLPRWLGFVKLLRWDLARTIEDFAKCWASGVWLARQVARGTPPIAVESTNYGIIGFALFWLYPRSLHVVRVSTLVGQISGNSFPLSSSFLRLQARLERLYLNACPALLTHTAEHRRCLSRVLGIPPRRFALIPHGITLPHLPTSAPPASNLRVTFLYVGRFEHRKGVDVLLQALPSVLRQFPQARVSLVGAGGDDWLTAPQYAPLLQPVMDRITYHGEVDETELTRQYATCDVLVAPSRYESFGLIYLEAMAFAKPVIGTHAGGIPEVVLDGETGLLTRPGDIPSLIACMRRLAESSTLRATLGQAGRLRAETRFSVSQVTRATTKLFRHLQLPSPCV